MNEIRTGEQEAAEDVYFGQVVANWARWYIIGAGIVLVLWTATEPTKLVVGIIPVVILMAINFYLHGRSFAEKPANRAMITLTSVLDIALITVVVLFWPGSAGIKSVFFVMYYPVVLAFAFIMPPKITIAYTVLAVAAYAGASIAADTALLTDVVAIESLVTRAITLAAMGALGTYYWRTQRNRRRAAAAATTAEA